MAVMSGIGLHYRVRENQSVTGTNRSVGNSLSDNAV
jgi:hypothetical protein